MSENAFLSHLPISIQHTNYRSLL